MESSTSRSLTSADIDGLSPSVRGALENTPPVLSTKKICSILISVAATLFCVHEEVTGPGIALAVFALVQVVSAHGSITRHSGAEWLRRCIGEGARKYLEQQKSPQIRDTATTLPGGGTPAGAAVHDLTEEVGQAASDLGTTVIQLLAAVRARSRRDDDGSADGSSLGAGGDDGGGDSGGGE